MRDDRNKRETRSVEIQQQLKAGSIPAEQKKQLQSELDTLESLHEQDLKDESAGKQEQQEELKIRQTMARGIIEQWMINKELYQQYGGRIIYQQLGPEPLDAMRDYLKEQQKKGAFKILEKSFEAPFWDYFVNDSKHDFYEQGSKEEKQAFGKAPWQQKQEN